MEWATHHAVAIGSALLAAFFAAVGIVIRQRAIQEEAAHRDDAGPIVTSWVRRPAWWAGTLVAVGGYAFQALALAHGSLLLVQPAWSVALAGAVPVVILCVVAAHRTLGRTRAMLLATAVAVLVGVIAVLTKVSVHHLAMHGWRGLLTVPAPYLLIVLAVAVTVLQQSAFHAGALQASVPIMLVGEPMVAVLLGVVILGEHLIVRGAGGLILTLAVAAMMSATIALGRDSAPRTTPVVDTTASIPRPASALDG
jgi:hypothetical protein